MKVVGYYNSFERQNVLEKLPLEVLTHLNYAFLLPKEDGTVYFKNEQDVARVVALGHQKGLKVFVSVGGWCDGDIVLNGVFEKIADSLKTVDFFVDNVFSMVTKFGFDGVDLDWEYPTMRQQLAFEYMVSQMRRKADEIGIDLTMAIFHSIDGEAKYVRISAISAGIVAKLDWVNVMTYDCHEEPNHSSRELAQKCSAYWQEIRGLSKEKVLIGIPFYAQPSMTNYCDLIERDHRNAFRDFVGNESLNSMYTVREKTYFARFNCGGVLIWAINYDTLMPKYSLLMAIKSAKG
jgi:GH18 family chitinase